MLVQYAPFTFALSQKLFASLAAQYPFAETAVLGRSVTKHGIFSLSVGKGEEHVLLLAGLSGKDSVKNLRWLLTLLLNEGAEDGDEELTEKQVGKLIHTGNFNEVKSSIFKAFSLGNNGTEEPPARDDEEDDGEDDEIRKNAAAGKE